MALRVEQGRGRKDCYAMLIYSPSMGPILEVQVLRDHGECGGDVDAVDAREVHAAHQEQLRAGSGRAAPDPGA